MRKQDNPMESHYFNSVVVVFPSRKRKWLWDPHFMHESHTLGTTVTISSVRHRGNMLLTASLAKQHLRTFAQAWGFPGVAHSIKTLNESTETCRRQHLTMASSLITSAEVFQNPEARRLRERKWNTKMMHEMATCWLGLEPSPSEWAHSPCYTVHKRGENLLLVFISGKECMWEACEVGWQCSRAF